MSPDDEASFVNYVTARRPHLRRIAYALSGDWHQADDLVQTALVKLYLAWPRLKRDGREEAYARKIIVRANIDDHRRPWRRERQGLPESDRVAPENTSDAPQDDIVRALQMLPPMQRKVVVLRYWLDMSIEEAAQELGIKPGTVKSHGFRALARLELLLAPRRSSAQSPRVYRQRDPLLRTARAAQPDPECSGEPLAGHLSPAPSEQSEGPETFPFHLSSEEPSTSG